MITSILILAAVASHTAECADQAAEREEGDGYDLRWELAHGTVGELFGLDDESIDFATAPELSALIVDTFTAHLQARGVRVVA